jgi:signal transduction histidine kinase
VKYSFLQWSHSMNSQEAIAFLLDPEGNIADIPTDPSGLGARIEIGTPFTRLVVRGSLAKALSFVTEIHKNGTAFNWEFALALGEQPDSFHFTGGKIGEQLLVVAAINGGVALQLYEDMMRINNEQTNALRKAFGDMKRDNQFYDELIGAQRALAKKNAQLVQLNQEKNRFLGIAAHNLRNPLSTIMGFSEFLLEDAEDEETREFLGVIHSSSEFMARLIDDLLDVAKIESGQVQLDYAPVDMNALLAESVARNRLLSARKNVEIDLSGEGIPATVVDRSKIEQVINNLISNAVKFSTPGSQVEVRMQGDDDLFRLEVQDWGTGIPADVQSNLFTPFQKGQMGTAGEKSTGLGLIIVKRIVEGHGGCIRLESAVDEGTTFFVSIPYAPATERPSGGSPVEK